MTTHYERLGVHRHADLAELQAARRRLARALHPDRNPAGAAAMSEANVAYDTLADPKLHKKYRAALRGTHADCPTCRGEGGEHRTKGFRTRMFHLCAACGGSGLLLKETT